MKYLTREINNAHIVWFEKSNQWAQLDEPQWFIFLFYEQGVEEKEATLAFQKQYNLSMEQARQTVSNVYDSVRKLINPDFPLPDFSLDAEKVQAFALPRSKTHHYNYLEKDFSITYGSRDLEYYIHQPLLHLKTDKTAEKGLHIEVFFIAGRVAMRLHDTVVKCLTADEAPQMKRLLYIELASYFYDIKQEGWMSFVHASAVKRNDQVLLISSASGSGKSTMAAMLLNHGFDFFSDDFVPVAGELLYPFPAALSIKNPNHLEIPDIRQPTMRTAAADLAFIEPSFQEQPTLAATTRWVCFIQYQPGAGMLLEPVSPLEALPLFHQEAWVGDNSQQAEKFLDWFEKLRFIKLIYDDNTKAIEALKTLMDKA